MQGGGNAELFEKVVNFVNNANVGSCFRRRCRYESFELFLFDIIVFVCKSTTNQKTGLFNYFIIISNPYRPSGFWQPTPKVEIYTQDRFVDHRLALASLMRSDAFDKKSFFINN
jgi:hypothetical protein